MHVPTYYNTGTVRAGLSLSVSDTDIDHLDKTLALWPRLIASLEK